MKLSDSDRELLISEMFTMSLKRKELTSGTAKNVQQGNYNE